jgi:MFS family permease
MATSDAAPASWQQLIRRRRTMLLVILGSYVVHSMVLYGVLMWTPTYMARAFGWTPEQIGAGYGLVHIIGTGIGTFVGGLVADRVLAKGHKDAHLRVFIGSQLIAWPIGLLAFSVSNPHLFLVLECLFFFIGLSYAGYAAATVQAIAPPGGRGRMASIYLLLLTIVGVGLGPWFVGLLTDHLFADPGSIGASIIVMMLVITPISVLVARAGLRPMRAAVAELEESASPAA